MPAISPQPSWIGELEANAGGQFDPRVVRLFVAELREHGHPLEHRRACAPASAARPSDCPAASQVSEEHGLRIVAIRAWQRV